MLFGFLMFLLVCAVVSILSNFGADFNILGSILALIGWIGNLPTYQAIVVCLAPFILGFIASQIIKAYRKKK